MDFDAYVTRTERVDKYEKPYFEILLKDKHSTFQLGATLSAWEARDLCEKLRSELLEVFESF